MYGTIATVRTMPGRSGEFADIFRKQRLLDHGLVSGWIATFVYLLDRDPNDAFMLAVFDSKDAYYENAKRPAQHQRYEEYRALLECDPEWHDGPITPYLVFAEGQNREGMYGTVARLTLKPGGEPAVDAFFSLWNEDTALENVPGAIGAWVLHPVEEPVVVYAAVLFESKRAYWANSDTAEQDQRYRKLREWLHEDPVWHDGHVVGYHRF